MLIAIGNTYNTLVNDWRATSYGMDLRVLISIALATVTSDITNHSFSLALSVGQRKAAHMRSTTKAKPKVPKARSPDEIEAMATQANQQAITPMKDRTAQSSVAIGNFRSVGHECPLGESLTRRLSAFHIR